MKTFAEFLPSMTEREREIVEAFDLSARRMEWPLDAMRATPPAKERLTIGGVVSKDSRDLFAVVWPNQEWPKGFEIGELVAVTKLED